MMVKLRYMKINSQLPPAFVPPAPKVALKILTFYTLSQSLTMSNISHKTPGEFKFEFARCLVENFGHGQRFWNCVKSQIF